VEALRQLDAEGVRMLDVAVRRPTLDDVFLTLTGHSAEEAEADGSGGTGDDQVESVGSTGEGEAR